jgi:YebC/PmpR family DNA-binding regulatory protein
VGGDQAQEGDRRCAPRSGALHEAGAGDHVAAREGGGDVDTNATLGNAVQKAKDASMPKDNIERAIAKGTGAGADSEAIETVIYEAYGPGGVAMLIEAYTENRNRTGADVRHMLSGQGASLAEPGSVAYLFERRGVVVVDATRYSEDDLLVAIEAGALDIVADEETYEVICEPSDLSAVRAALDAASIEIEQRGGGAAPDGARRDRRRGRDQAVPFDRLARGQRRRRRGARQLRRLRSRTRLRCLDLAVNCHSRAARDRPGDHRVRGIRQRTPVI